ncbi:MAG: hypothetical protein ONB44_02935 [candidate division KSB1 bacterium]|nr:hypothetical protein [candidate division KSB1 bacterium]MDZ7301081.1 hypothetical protein [candidate division KSB1 bacterium]MDZ7312095.1 hypothetical protein [candidate division KSB1 bacterium]
MSSRSQKFILGFFLLLCACGELERSNPLDPQNPRSERRRIVFVEAFVNDTAPFSSFAMIALDSLAAAFPQEQVIIVEHHLPSAQYPDAQALSESADRYKILANAGPAVPDVFFNGSGTRAQGASSTSNALLRYRSAVGAEIDKIAHFTIEARKRIAAASLDIEVTIARLGSSAFSQFAVLAIVWEDLKMAGHHHVVRKILPPENFSGIQAGEKKSVHMMTSLSGTVNTGQIQVAVIIEQATGLGREVLQATLAE